MQTGIISALKNGNYKYLDRNDSSLSVEEKEEITKLSMNADVYLSSANAVTEDGELYNVDGNSNRVSSLLYGHDKVIIVVGTNKIVKDLDEAVYRVKNDSGTA